MNITFLLGNGFDIGLGLKTRYEDFYDEYSKHRPEDNENIRAFKDVLKGRKSCHEEKISDWSDFEKAFGEHSSEFEIKQKLKYIERFEDFVMRFNSYLENEERRLDFSDKELISRTMNTAVATYFYIREERGFMQSVYASADARRTYNFLSFNYTKSVDRCAQILKEHLDSDSSRDVGKVLHVHGFIEENMIMGVNDASQIINEEFAKDEDVVREIVKSQQDSDVRANYEKQAIDVINESDIICIYGMSIGETDKKWWSAIAKWLAQSEKRVLVILKYDKNYSKRFIFLQTRFIDSVTNRFLELSEQTKEIQTKIRSRVFVGMNHNVFEMFLCENREEDNQFIRRNRAWQEAVRLAENSGVLKHQAFLGQVMRLYSKLYGK